MPTNIFDMTDTWNNVGTTFNGIKMNVSNSASAAASKLLDLQVGSVSEFSIAPDGIATGETPTAGDNSKKLATTAFVTAADAAGDAALLAANNTWAGLNNYSQQVTLLNLTGGNAFVARNFTNATTATQFTFQHSRGTSIGAHAAVIVGDSLGTIAFHGSDGAAFANGVQLVASCNSAPTPGHVPSDLIFVMDNGTTLAERLRLRADGNLIFSGGGIVGVTTGADAGQGIVGEYKECVGGGSSNIVTISNASPAVVTDAAHGMSIGAAVNFTTNGALPTGLSVGVNYYVSSQGYAAGAYSVSTSVANALTGVSVNTSSAGSGTHSKVAQGIMTVANTTIDIGGISLPPGDWDVDGLVRFVPQPTTTIVNEQSGISNVSATMPSIMYGIISVPSGSPPIVASSFAQPRQRFNVGVSTNVYLVARSNFAVSTMSAVGLIRARRVR
jgi:hypothetical protein